MTGRIQYSAPRLSAEIDRGITREMRPDAMAAVLAAARHDVSIAAEAGS